MQILFASGVICIFSYCYFRCPFTGFPTLAEFTYPFLFLLEFDFCVVHSTWHCPLLSTLFCILPVWVFRQALEENICGNLLSSFKEFYKKWLFVCLSTTQNDSYWSTSLHTDKIFFIPFTFRLFLYQNYL